jgi:hypothetical protein
MIYAGCASLSQNQYLYFVSDREMVNDYGILEVKLDDIYYDSNNKTIGTLSHIGGPWNFKGTVQFPKDDDLRNNRHCAFNCFKVLATTDSSLGLPLIGQPFLEKYVEKQGKIDEVMIEMECLRRISDTEHEYGVKVRTSDKTVIIGKVKDSWTKEEIRFNISEFMKKYKNTSNVHEARRIIDELIVWINENL